MVPVSSRVSFALPMLNERLRKTWPHHFGCAVAHSSSATAFPLQVPCNAKGSPCGSTPLEGGPCGSAHIAARQP